MTRQISGQSETERHGLRNVYARILVLATFIPCLSPKGYLAKLALLWQFSLKQVDSSDWRLQSAQCW